MKTLKGKSKHFYFTKGHNKKWLNTELYIVPKNLKCCMSNSFKIPNAAHFIVNLEMFTETVSLCISFHKVMLFVQ